MRSLIAIPLTAFLAASVSTTALLAQAPGGQAPQGRGNQPPPPPMTNLQIFPKDATRPQVVTVMQGFTQALGVRCQYCHVDDDPGRQNDMASDEKPPKKAARQMMLLVRDLNEKLPSAVGKTADATTRVGCVTCHRGVAIPKQLADILTDTAAAKGVPAAIEQYRDLRKQYYGAMAYDFSEGGLLVLAQRLVANNRPDDALSFLQLNTEFYPKSARTYVAMSQAYGRKNDKDNQIKSLEKASELDPENQQIKGQLQRLKSGD